MAINTQRFEIAKTAYLFCSGRTPDDSEVLLFVNTKEAKVDGSPYYRVVAFQFPKSQSGHGALNYVLDADKGLLFLKRFLSLLDLVRVKKFPKGSHLISVPVYPFSVELGLGGEPPTHYSRLSDDPNEMQVQIEAVRKPDSLQVRSLAMQFSVGGDVVAKVELTPGYLFSPRQRDVSGGIIPPGQLVFQGFPRFRHTGAFTLSDSIHKIMHCSYLTERKYAEKRKAAYEKYYKTKKA